MLYALQYIDVSPSMVEGVFYYEEECMIPLTQFKFVPIGTSFRLMTSSVMYIKTGRHDAVKVIEGEIKHPLSSFEPNTQVLVSPL